MLESLWASITCYFIVSGIITLLMLFAADRMDDPIIGLFKDNPLIVILLLLFSPFILLVGICKR